jgi:hypothetical protein
MVNEMETILLIVQDHTGHSKREITWDPKDPVQVQEMKDYFCNLKAKGYFFFECKRVLGIFKKEGKEVSELPVEKGRLFFRKDSKIQIVENNDAVESPARMYEMMDPDRNVIEPDRQYTASTVLVGG